MRKRLVFFMTIFFLFLVGLSGCLGPESGIMVTKLDRTPANFVNMTEDQMKIFPHLKEAILRNKTIMAIPSAQEADELRGILQYFDTDFINYQDKYYEIKFYSAD